MIILSKLKQPRLSGRTIASSFINSELSSCENVTDIREIVFDFSEIKSVNQSFFNEMLKLVYLRYPLAHIYPANVANPDLLTKFNQELARIKKITAEQN
ncbi:MAG: DUF4325 domain-containing protein [Bdellovibrio sp.]|nr:DUF4325 domain-containing protein [Bdellovibrio sp.]